MQHAKLGFNRLFISKASIFVTVASFALLGFGTAIGTANAAAKDHSAAFVQTKGGEAINVLSNVSLPEAARRQQFGEIILQTFDVSLVSQSVLGSYHAKATPDQLGKFQTVFKDALAQIYIGRFFDYDGRSLQVKSARLGDNGTTVVESSVANPTGSEVHTVDWVVTGTAGKERLIDVVVDGISTNATTQQDYASVLRTANGNLDVLITKLKAMVQ
jgi:ABC-type transporter MlaC component